MKHHATPWFWRCYRGLPDVALQIGAKIGPVEVDTGGTACEVPYAPDYIQRVRKRGAIGKKRKTTKY